MAKTSTTYTEKYSSMLQTLTDGVHNQVLTGNVIFFDKDARAAAKVAQQSFCNDKHEPIFGSGNPSQAGTKVADNTAQVTASSMQAQMSSVEENRQKTNSNVPAMPVFPGFNPGAPGR